MYLLRRAAVRTLSQHPSHSISTLRPASRVTSRQNTVQPTTLRPFHQARIWLANGQNGEVEEASPVQAQTSGETVTTEPSAAEQQIKAETQPASAQDAMSESSGSTSAPTGQSEAPASQQPAGAASTMIENAQDMAASVAAPVAQTVTSAARTARDAFDTARDGGRPQKSSQPRNESRGGNRRDDLVSSGGGFRDIRPSRILYVGNLFFEVTAAQLQTEFERFGEVTNSRIVTDARGMSKGFGYMEFADQESADRAVREIDQKVFQGRRMAVQYHVRKEKTTPDLRPRNPIDPTKTLFIGNMSYQMSDRDLNDLFREIRNVLDVRVAIDRRSGQPRGFAHADFIDIESAQRAKEFLEKKTVYGRQLRVDYSTSASQTQPAREREP